MKSSQKTVFAWLVLVMMTVVLLQTAKVNPLEKKITFPQFIEAVAKRRTKPRIIS